MPAPLTKERLFCLQDCQTYAQYHRMRKAFEEELCVFCQIDRNFNKILFEDEYVLGWEVPEQIKRKELAVQLLAVPKFHARYEWDISSTITQSIHVATRFFSERYDLRGGMVFERFGRMDYNAGTVDHWHRNIWVPNGSGEVRIPIFKDPTHQERNREGAGGGSYPY